MDILGDTDNANIYLLLKAIKTANFTFLPFKKIITCNLYTPDDIESEHGWGNIPQF